MPGSGYTITVTSPPPGVHLPDLVADIVHVDVLLLEAGHIVDVRPGAVLHHQHAGRRVVPVDRGNLGSTVLIVTTPYIFHSLYLEPGEVFEYPGHLLRVPGLLSEVQLQGKVDPHLVGQPHEAGENIGHLAEVECLLVPELREDDLDCPDKEVAAPDIHEAVLLDVLVLHLHCHHLNITDEHKHNQDNKSSIPTSPVCSVARWTWARLAVPKGSASKLANTSSGCKIVK